MIRSRIFSEHLPPAQLGAPRTLKLLHDFSVQPIVALPPRAQTQQMGRALAALSEATGGVGLWPLLHDDDGYWPSNRNFSTFEERVFDVMRFAAAHKVRAQTVITDLEPPLDQLTQLLGGGPMLRMLWAGRRMLAPGLRRGRHAQQLGRWVAARHQEGLEVVGTVFPPVVWDFSLPRAPVSKFLDTPFHRALPLAPMFYSSVLAGLLPGGRPTALRLMGHWARRLVVAQGPQAMACLGLVGVGKLEDEPVWSSPAALVEDLELVTGAGIRDVILFALEGVLQDPEPERWLRPLLRLNDSSAGSMLPRRAEG